MLNRKVFLPLKYFQKNLISFFTYVYILIFMSTFATRMETFTLSFDQCTVYVNSSTYFYDGKYVFYAKLVSFK